VYCTWAAIRQHEWRLFGYCSITISFSEYVECAAKLLILEPRWAADDPAQKET